MRHIISKYLTYYLYDVDVQYKRSKWPFKAQIYFTGYKWMFLNDNQIYVTTKFTSKYARANTTGKFKM